MLHKSCSKNAAGTDSTKSCDLCVLDNVPLYPTTSKSKQQGFMLLPEFTHIYLMSLKDITKQLQDAGADAYRADFSETDISGDEGFLDMEI